MDPCLVETAAFVFGLCIGSFLNVCIYRIPARKSIVHPGSMCPGCGNQVRFYDNIPLLSFVLLKGRCRDCRSRIPARYPLVELLTGMFALCCYLRYGLSGEALIYFGFIAALLVVTFIDIDHQIIPDVISLPGIMLGLAVSLVLPHISFTESLIGLLAGGGSLFLVAWGYYLLTRKEGMGGGDIKLLAMIGTIVGVQGIFFTIFTASLVGTLAGVIAMVKSNRNMKLAVPFGPFLSIGAILYLFWGQALIQWYLGLLG